MEIKKMSKMVSILVLLSVVLVSCGGSGVNNGELVSVKEKRAWYAEKPLGMVLIPGGSFTMGKSDEDLLGGLSTPSTTVNVSQFYMDETEISNGEYKTFVYWVRDSVARTKLAIAYDDLLLIGGEGEEINTGIEDYKFKEIDTTSATAYEKYMLENYGGSGDYNSETEGRALDWNNDLVWNKNDYPDVSYVEVMDSLLISVEDSFEGNRMIDVRKLKYRHKVFDESNAARKQGSRKDFISESILEIYPDTTVWLRDYLFSYNDPMHQNYFWHEAYLEYPVVGVSWDQAKAFCSWRTKRKNDFLRNQKNPTSIPYFRLPTEAEWEFAARGGLEYATYPWGGPYTVTDRGCFYANFKPGRGNYTVDGALYTMKVDSFPPNGYGLYNMAGNVSEWTNSSYNEESYLVVSTMNPDVNSSEISNKRKVIRGGSWKDTAYFLEVSSRDYEYADSVRSYIGFRTVQGFLGKN